MSGQSVEVPLGRFLEKEEGWVDIQPDGLYKQVTVKLWGRGAVLRSEVSGVEIGSSRRPVIRTGQFILSRIDARNGACCLVPPDLDGAVVSNDFPVFRVNESLVIPRFFEWMSKTRQFVRLCRLASEGTTNRVRLQEDRFLASRIVLPSLDEQHWAVVLLDEVASKIEEVKTLQSDAEAESVRALDVAFRDLIQDAPYAPMSKVAPVVRRPITVDPFSEYYEIGVRSFGKGTFHKDPVSGLALGNKRIFRIEDGDLIFSNVFAWEGAVAVAAPEDDGRVGSHRFITCVPRPDAVTAPFLWFYFLTPDGLRKLGAASPGGAGRNRTLGLDALSKIEVPVPSLDDQLRFNDLQRDFSAVRSCRLQLREELDTFLPALLDRAFRGEL